jgi:hypothetical protein
MLQEVVDVPPHHQQYFVSNYYLPCVHPVIAVGSVSQGVDS